MRNRWRRAHARAYDAFSFRCSLARGDGLDVRLVEVAATCGEPPVNHPVRRKIVERDRSG